MKAGRAAWLQVAKGSVTLNGTGLTLASGYSKTVARLVLANLTVTVDHRVVDGAMAASFLTAVKRNLEDPKLLFNLLDA